ncbi:hypothetical protein SK128_021173 [Halocaridina rubra]|uniref:PDZ domain-containing protein n=1 Tax=Halocaridina rubra TaxID=373956 RepID=A0AAN8ZWJ2_HALRR
MREEGDRIVGINGRSVENLPYSGAVDLLREIEGEVTLLVSQLVVSSTSTTPTVKKPAPAPPTSSLVGSSQKKALGDNSALGTEYSAGGDLKVCSEKDCDDRGGPGCARVQAVGGARSFIREVRSGPVTVITVNTDSSATPRPQETSKTETSSTASAHTTPTHSGTLKQGHWAGLPPPWVPGESILVCRFPYRSPWPEMGATKKHFCRVKNTSVTNFVQKGAGQIH